LVMIAPLSRDFPDIPGSRNELDEDRIDYVELFQCQLFDLRGVACSK